MTSCLGKGVFTKEIEVALLDGTVDLAVHSMKDLPTELPDGLCIVAIPAREDPRDVLVTQSGVSLDELPKAAKIGTTSPRRRSQLLYLPCRRRRTAARLWHLVRRRPRYPSGIGESPGCSEVPAD